MPFKSERQRAWMHKNKPKLAKEWESKTPKDTKLPEKASRNGPKTRRPRRLAK